MSEPAGADGRLAVRVELRGRVQGVGFRPWVCREARALGLSGTVRNTTSGVELELSGREREVCALLARLLAPQPPARLTSLAVREAEPGDEAAPFAIAQSRTGASVHGALAPDLAPCRACRDEIRDPGARRHRYPFTSCAHCGPRASIALGLPWDRARTTMARFALCAACRAEYEDPDDRRFHAQTIACPACGPRLIAVAAGGEEPVGEGGRALEIALGWLARGAIVALQGVGGFQLLCDATCAPAVRRLRERKRRPHKPFALLVADLAAARRIVHVPPAGARLLASAAAPIVLLPARGERSTQLVAPIAPGLDHLGVMLPASPLHLLLAEAFGRPLVCTSGNVSGQPLAVSYEEARRQLGAVADGFVYHDREIATPLDDAVWALGAAGPQRLRTGRGCVPLRIARPEGGTERSVAPGVLAVGGHQAAAAAALGPEGIELGPHVGDLEGPRARRRLERSVETLRARSGLRIAAVARDRHPDYGSRAVAERTAAALHCRCVAVQHHHAHVAAVLLERGWEGPVFGVAWDGTGYGADGTVWGGEGLEVARTGWRRRVWLHPFRLPGAQAAVYEPWRTALGLLLETYGAREALEIARRCALPGPGCERLARAVRGGRLSVTTTSAGRLFDGVAALLGLRLRTSYRGQAAMELEALARTAAPDAPAPCARSIALVAQPGGGVVWDWRPVLREIVAWRLVGGDPAAAAARWHVALAAAVCAAAARIGLPRVVLCGGCFQNRLLEALCVRGLRAAGLEVACAGAIPPGDGGLAAGQAAVAQWTLDAEGSGDVSRDSG